MPHVRSFYWCWSILPFNKGFHYLFSSRRKELISWCDSAQLGWGTEASPFRGSQVRLGGLGTAPKRGWSFHGPFQRKLFYDSLNKQKNLSSHRFPWWSGQGIKSPLDSRFSAVTPDKANCKSSELTAEGPVLTHRGVVPWVRWALGQLLLWEGFKTRAPSARASV